MLEAKSNISLKSMHGKSFNDSQMLATNFPYISAQDDKTIMLRDGSLMCSFTVDGISADTNDGLFTFDFCDSFARYIAQQRVEIGYYVHRISSEEKPTLSDISDPPFQAEINNRWQDYLQTSFLRKRVTVVTIILKPAKRAFKLLHLFDKDDSSSRENIALRMARLDTIVKTFMNVLTPAKPKRLTISGGEWLGLLRTMIDGSTAPLSPGEKFIPLSDLMSNSTIKFKGNIFVTQGLSEEHKRFGTMISIKDYPIGTYPGITDNLNLPFDTVVTNSFTPIENLNAQSKIARVRRQMTAAEDAAISLLAQLESAEDDVASGKLIFGNHHCSIALFCKSLDELDDATNYVTRAVQDAGAGLIRESFSARAVYFAQHPGNFSYRTRPTMISSQNFTQFSALHGQPKGNPPEECPWGEAVTKVPTARGETFNLSFHLPGKADQRTVGHTLVLGQTGSGKTLGTAFLLSQANRLNPRIIVFDKDNGFEMAIRAMGGDYSSVRAGLETNFNPFMAEADARGAAWLSDWLITLADNEGEPLNAIQVQAVEDAVQANVTADQRLQNFEQFHNQLRATDDEGDLYNRLNRWDELGQFGWLFGGKQEDPLKFTNRITAFDLTEIFDNDTIRTAWLSYVFRRIERIVEDEYPTIIVLDEAWKLFDDVYFEKRLKDWMLTMRKKNVVVILLTQRVTHIVESAAGSAILESAVTRLVYPSTFNTEAELAPLELTNAESEFLRTSNVGNQFVLYKSGTDSLVLDFDLSGIGGGLDILGGGRGEKASKNWRDDPKFYVEMMK